MSDDTPVIEVQGLCDSYEINVDDSDDELHPTTSTQAQPLQSEGEQATTINTPEQEAQTTTTTTTTTTTSTLSSSKDEPQKKYPLALPCEDASANTATPLETPTSGSSSSSPTPGGDTHSSSFSDYHPPTTTPGGDGCSSCVGENLITTTPGGDDHAYHKSSSSSSTYAAASSSSSSTRGASSSSGGEEMVQCPLCFNYWKVSVIEEHCGKCGTESAPINLDEKENPMPTGDNSLMEDILAHNVNDHQSADALFAQQLAEEDEILREEDKAKRLAEEEQATLRYLQEEEIARKVQEENKKQQQENSPLCDLCNKDLPFAVAENGTATVHCLESCAHVFCRKCISDWLTTRASEPGATIDSIICPATDCLNSMSNTDLQQLLPQATHEVLLNNELYKLVQACPDSFVKCPSCSVIIERDTSNTAKLTEELKHNTGTRSVDGEQISAEAYMHREIHRFRCSNCSTEFCGSCAADPYHLGKTCEQYKRHKEARRCRFCDQALELSRGRKRKNCGNDVCFSSDCEQRGAEVCLKTLPCGHQCCGIRNEKPCLPCLVDDCPTSSECGGDYCTICYTEGLSAAPCIKLDCGHLFHSHCIKTKLVNKWPGARITFGFLNCPNCGTEISHTSLQHLREMKDLLKLREDIRRRARLRMQHEGLDRNEKLQDKNSKFYQNPDLFAEHTLCYYQCFKCQNPYFGGFKSCENMADDGDDDRKFNPAELVCAGCIPNADLKECKAHGTEFVEYKCKFCCNVAQWYCWGSTHFCTACHKSQEKGEYVTKKKLEDLPQCPGKKKCPIGMEHPAPGVEFALGCSICRKQREF